MKREITVERATELWLQKSSERLAFFHSELRDFLKYVRETKTFEGHEIKGIRKNSNIRKKTVEMIDYLTETNLIDSHYNYFILKNKVLNELQIVCSLYERGYISYLSAMKYYGLTTESLKHIDYTAPTRKQWTQYKSDNSLNRMGIKRPYPSELIRIRGKQIVVHSRTHAYNPNFKNSIRVISIGDLFLEMVKHPDLCGGFEKVLDVYTKYAQSYMNDIVYSLEKFGTDIDKSRVGYILDCYLKIADLNVLSWKASCLARGGNRKMISSNCYSEIYSSEWNLSLNHELLYQ